jgi:hypothetical protein
MHRSWFFVPVLGWLAACGTNPCDDYVSYMCECHPDDEDFSCEDLRRQFEGADPELQDECTLELDEQQEEDEANGVECGEEAAADDTGGAGEKSLTP